MNGDMLVSWMTHVEEGSWTTFRNSLAQLAGKDANVTSLSSQLRVWLSDFGIADFFIDGSQRWRILKPCLGCLQEQRTRAILIGGRTPRLIEALRNAAEKNGCELHVDNAPNYPSSIYVSGEGSAIESIARSVGIAFHSDLAMTLAGKLLPIQVELESAEREPAPRNWTRKTFDFELRQWIDTLLPNSPCEFTPRLGHSKFLLHRRHGRFVRISKRESIYAAAFLKGIRLIEYDVASKRLAVPTFAPLPDKYSRAVSLCSGRHAEIVGGRFEYVDVPLELARFISIAAGQSAPEHAELVKNRDAQ